MDFLDIMSLIGAVVVIIGALILTYYGTRWYAKRMGMGSNGGRYVKIIDRVSLTQGSAVYIVKTAGQYYMLGVSDKKVSLLTELPDLEEIPEGSTSSGSSFSQVMRGILNSRGEDGEGK